MHCWPYGPKFRSAVLEVEDIKIIIIWAVTPYSFVGRYQDTRAKIYTMKMGATDPPKL
jgi:hypothetical protein